LAFPDCIAFLAGLKIRAVMDGRTLSRNNWVDRNSRDKDGIPRSKSASLILWPLI
jgi:hypothetical protein